MTQSPLKVAQIGTSDRQGGAAAVSRALHEGLVARGIDARMLVGVRRSDDPRVRCIFDTVAGRWLRRVTGRQVRRTLHRRLAPWLGSDIVGLPRRAWLAAPELAAADVVHAHNLHGFFFNLKVLPELSARRPFVWTLHDMWPMTSYWIHAFECSHWPDGGCGCEPPNSLPALRWNNGRGLWRLKRDLTRRSSMTLVAPSDWMRRQIERGMLREHPVRVIPNGVDLQLFQPGPKSRAREELDLPADATLVLYVGKGGGKNPWKGWRHAAEAARALSRRPDTRFVFVGGGLGAELGEDIDVIDAGLVREPRRLARYFQACDVLLYPTLADNCPLVVLEAMASGLPVVAFGTGGVPELIRDGVDGAVVEPGSTADLIAALTALLDAKARRDSAGAEARSRAVRRFGVERMIEAYLDLYGGLYRALPSGPGTLSGSSSRPDRGAKR